MGTSSSRVAEHTAFDVTQKLTQAFRRSLTWYAQRPSEIPRRLKELDREWDVERVLATGSSCLSLLGLALGISRRRRWLALPAIVQSFYLQHTLQGWCPPLPLLRRAGFRTPNEIEREKAALKEILRDVNAEETSAAATAGDVFEDEFSIVVEELAP